MFVKKCFENLMIKWPKSKILIFVTKITHYKHGFLQESELLKKNICFSEWRIKSPFVESVNFVTTEATSSGGWSPIMWPALLIVSYLLLLQLELIRVTTTQYVPFAVPERFRNVFYFSGGYYPVFVFVLVLFVLQKFRPTHYPGWFGFSGHLRDLWLRVIYDTFGMWMYRT